MIMIMIMIVNASRSYTIYVNIEQAQHTTTAARYICFFLEPRCIKQMMSDKLICVTCTAIRYICLCNKYVLIGVRCVTVLANVSFISLTVL